MDKIEDTNIDNHIAIIGMACRLPGANTIDEYWNNLSNGIESLSEFTDEELLAAGIPAEKIRLANYVKKRGIVRGSDKFDAAFFGFTPRDAELIDPQHRIFLECAWHAMEDAGIVPELTEERVAVFGGVGTNWHLGNVDQHPEVQKFASGASVVTSNDKDYLTTRVSYKLNLTGPSVNVQCACSTALVATNLGINSLLSYQSDLVLAGGATIETPETKGYIYQEGGMESPDGRCRPFDANANGTVFSRGAGVVLLKRLSDALRDEDSIYAVIIGGAINNDGNQKLSFTSPSVNGQAEVAIEAMELAGISAESISFVEAHGTATPLGDPIEVASLTQAFRYYTDNNQFCALGSVKGNIGHTDVASGAASLIKSALALKYGKLPASLNFETPNPKIDFPNSPFFVNTGFYDLPKSSQPLRALVNSFGVGGTNASIILQEPPKPVVRNIERPANVLLLSAKTQIALDNLNNTVKNYLEQHPELNLADLAYTYQTGRQNFKHRRFIGFSDRNDLLTRLDNRSGDSFSPPTTSPLIVFAFPGQGNQYLGMGSNLYQNESVYRDAIDECCEILRPHLDIDLRDLMFAPVNDRQAAEILNQTRYTQPAIFITSYAMAKCWLSWGIQPDAMIGHSVGEYVAATLAGVFSLQHAVLAIAQRSQLIQNLPGGSMLAVLLPEQEITPLLSSVLSVAAVNNPGLTVVAGPTPAISELEDYLLSRKIFSKRLDTSHAFHSAMMEPALSDFAKTIDRIDLHAPRIPIVSTVTGNWLTADESTNPDYWVQHMRHPVRFSDAFKTLVADSNPIVFLECGPSHSLASAAKQHGTPQEQLFVVSSMRSVTDTDTDSVYLMNACGAMWAAARPVSWSAFYGKSLPRRVSAPGYPFERIKFALDFSKNLQATIVKTNDKKLDVGDWFYVPCWRRTPRPELLQMSKMPVEEQDKHSWLIFDDTLGLADHIAACLQRMGEQVIRIGISESYQKINSLDYSLRPDQAEDYIRLLIDLKNEDITPDRVIHLWSINTDDKSLQAINADVLSSLNFYSPLFIQQAFISQNQLDDLCMIVVANGACDVIGECVNNPANALAIGPCRVIGKELPKISCRFVDLLLSENTLDPLDLAKNLILETSLKSDDTVVAYRNRQRWTEHYEPTYFQPAGNGLKENLCENGVYLITGGLGGLGLYFAQKMAELMPIKLILTYRSPLPARETWENWLAGHDEHDANSEKIRGLMNLEAIGATVMLAQVDSSDTIAMTKVVNEATGKYGRIKGVIHSAGIAGGGIISLKTRERADEVLEAKVRGTLALNEIFQIENLDFLLLFSSVTSVLGEPGRVDYCSANSFMDAIANYWNQSYPGRVISLNWGSWGELGMAARWEENKQKRHHSRMPVKSSTATGHIQWVANEGSQEIYEVFLNPEEDWVINQHRVFGIPAVVGTMFLELIHQFAKIKHPNSTPVIESCYFLSPLFFEPGTSRRIRLFVTESNGKFKFSFKSQIQDNQQWLEHFMGELQPAALNPGRTCDLSALSGLIASAVDYRPWPLRVPAVSDNPVLELGKRWDNLKETRIGTDEWLVRLELHEEFIQDLASYPFHPAMVDVALVAATQFLTTSPYLPLGYKRVSFIRGFSRKVWSHIRLHGQFQEGDEFLSFDISVFDEHGDELLSVEHYSLRKISTQRPENTQKTDVVQEAATKTPTLKKIHSRSQPKDILPEEGLDALKRVFGAARLPQVLICTSELQALIDEEKPSVKIAQKKEGIEKAQQQSSGHPRPSLSTPYEAPDNEIEKAIHDIWQGVLGINQIGINDDFTELGGNSLLAVQTVANTSDTFQVDIPMDVFYQNLTIKGLAQAVIERLIAMVDDDALEELMAELEE